jgi:hypothetical protein
MSTIKDFIQLYRLYRVKHPPVYALQRAYQIAFKSYPF